MSRETIEEIAEKLCTKYPEILGELSKYSPEDWELNRERCRAAVERMPGNPRFDEFFQDNDLYSTMDAIVNNWMGEKPIIRFAAYFLCWMAVRERHAVESELSKAWKSSGGLK